MQSFRFDAHTALGNIDTISTICDLMFYINPSNSDTNKYLQFSRPVAAQRLTIIHTLDP